MRPEFLEAWTHEPRHAALEATREAIQAVGGMILDVHQFSNKLTHLHLELPPEGVPAWLVALHNGHILADEIQAAALREAASRVEAADLEVRFALFFAGETTELKDVIPKVPG